MVGVRVNIPAPAQGDGRVWKHRELVVFKSRAAREAYQQGGVASVLHSSVAHRAIGDGVVYLLQGWVGLIRRVVSGAYGHSRGCAVRDKVNPMECSTGVSQITEVSRGLTDLRGR